MMKRFAYYLKIVSLLFFVSSSLTLSAVKVSAIETDVHAQILQLRNSGQHPKNFVAAKRLACCSTIRDL